MSKTDFDFSDDEITVEIPRETLEANYERRLREIEQREEAERVAKTVVS